MNIFQILLLLIFVCIFAYYWTPRGNDYTEEYLALLDNYNKLVCNFKKAKQQIKILTQNEGNTDATIGSNVSAHSKTVKPTNRFDHDNFIIDQLIN